MAIILIAAKDFYIACSGLFQRKFIRLSVGGKEKKNSIFANENAFVVLVSNLLLYSRFLWRYDFLKYSFCHKRFSIIKMKYYNFNDKVNSPKGCFLLKTFLYFHNPAQKTFKFIYEMTARKSVIKTFELRF